MLQRMSRCSRGRPRAPLPRTRSHAPRIAPSAPSQPVYPRSSRSQALQASRLGALRSSERPKQAQARARPRSHHHASPCASPQIRQAAEAAIAQAPAPRPPQPTRHSPLRRVPEVASERATIANPARRFRRCPTASRTREHPAAGPRTSSATAANERAPRRRARSRAGSLRVGHARVRCDCLRRARQAAPASTSAATVAKNSNQRDSMRAQGVRRADRAPARRRDADYPVGRDAATPRALRRWRRCRISGNASARATIAITTPLIGRVKNTVQSFW